MILGLIAGFFASLLGWQINLVAIHRGLARGRIAAFLLGFGAAAADIVFILLSFSGAILLLHHPGFKLPLKWIGIVTIITVAATIFFYEPHGEKSIAKRNPTKNFLIGFFLVIGNPAVLLLWMGVVSFILTHFPESEKSGFNFLFLAGFIAGASVWFLILSLVILPKIRQWGENSLRLISKVSAVALLIAALVLIFEKF